MSEAAYAARMSVRMGRAWEKPFGKELPERDLAERRRRV